MLSIDLIDKLKARIPEYKIFGRIKIESLKPAFEIAGYEISERDLSEIRNALSKSIEYLDLEEFEEVLKMLKSEKMFPTVELRPNFDMKSDLKFYSNKDTVGSLHTISSAEERGYSEWINRLLKNDVDLIYGYIPIHLGGDDLYHKCKDGILLCKLINKSVDNTIDERAINKGANLKSLFTKQENLVLAIKSASAIGCCVVNIGSGDILEGTKHIILGLIWQIIRVGLLKEINLVHHPNLSSLLLENETLDQLKKLSPEELLIRWVNFQLKKAGCEKRIKNFKEDVTNAEIYMHLIYQIAPEEKKSQLVAPQEILKVKDTLRRAELVLNNAAILDARVFVTPEDIACAADRGKNRDKLNLAFIANLFNNYPTLDPISPKEIREEIFVYEETIEMNLEERTYINWMNSMGLSKPISNLYYNISDGLVYLRILDFLNPGCVNWWIVVEEFDPRKRLFQELENCNEVINAAKKCNLKVQQISGDNLLRQDRIYVLGFTFQLMRYFCMKMLLKLNGNKPLDEKDILRWVNSKLSTRKIMNFRDYHLSDSKLILELIETIRPGSVNFRMISDNKESNANYAISVARKVGANVFILPEHILSCNQKMLLTLFAGLMAVDIKH